MKMIRRKLEELGLLRKPEGQRARLGNYLFTLGQALSRPRNLYAVVIAITTMNWLGWWTGVFGHTAVLAITIAAAATCVPLLIRNVGETGLLLRLLRTMTIQRARRRSFSGMVGRAVTQRHTLVLVGLGSLIAGCWLLGGPSWFLVFNALMAGWYAIDILVVQYRVAAGIYGETAPEVLAAANFVIRKRGGRSGGGGHFDKVFETAADAASNRATVHAPGEAVAR